VTAMDVLIIALILSAIVWLALSGGKK